jgi:hypothetical protein
MNTGILNWPGPPWEGDSRTGRDEPIGVVKHMHGNKTKNLPRSYLYLKLAQTLCFSNYVLCFFSSTKLENKRVGQVLPGGERGWHQWEAEVAGKAVAG